MFAQKISSCDKSEMDFLGGQKKAHGQAGQTRGERAINWKDKRGMESAFLC